MSNLTLRPPSLGEARAALERVGGKYALSNQVLATLLFLFLLITTLNTFTRFKSAYGPMLLNGAATAFLVVGALLFMRRLLLPVSERNARPALALTTYAISGAAWGLIRDEHNVTSLDSGSSLTGRAFVPMLLALLVASLMANWLAERAGHRAMLERLLADNAQLNSIRDNYERELEEFRAEQLHRVQAALDPAMAEIRNRLNQLDPNQAGEVRAVSELLLQSVTEVVRPLSHSFTDTGTHSVAREMSPQIREAQRQRWPDRVNVPASIRPMIFLVAGMIWTLIGLALLTAKQIESLGGFPLGLFPTTLSTLLAWPILVAFGRFWPKRWSVLSVRWGLLFLSLVYWITLLVPRYVLLFVWNREFFTTVVLSSTLPLSILFLCVGVLVSATTLAATRRRDLQAELRRVNTALDLAIARLRKELWSASRALSWYIHGPVQSALLSTGVLLAGGPLSPERLAESRRIIEEAVGELNSGRSLHPDLDLVLAELHRVWGFACAIEAKVDRDLLTRIADDHATAATSAEIIREAVSNAVRHGHANEISIRISEVPGPLLRLEVEDNGRGLAADYVPGLGTKMLEDTTFGWSRDQLDTGLLLWAELAL